MNGAVAGNDLPFNERPITPASLSTIGTSCVDRPAYRRQRHVADLEHAEEAVGHLVLGMVVRVVHADAGASASNS